MMERQREKLEKSLGGIKDMPKVPDLMVVIDTNREDIAIKEAEKLGIPVIAVIDSNSSADGVAYPIPGNDDATRAIKLYCKLLSDAVLDGIQNSLVQTEEDSGESAELPIVEEAAIAEAIETPATDDKVVVVETKKAKAKPAVKKAEKEEASEPEAVEAKEEEKSAVKKVAAKKLPAKVKEDKAEAKTATKKVVAKKTTTKAKTTKEEK
jgi:small subunit ribosomal protein S2